MHFAKSEKTQGLAYLTSFALGCATVMILVWVARWLVYSMESRSLSQGFERLPSLHLTTIGPHAALAGLIWSIGNASSILAVEYLGQGVGYSIVQSQLLVAGVWGALWYAEIRSSRRLLSWFLFASITVAGILLLSREHMPTVVPVMAHS